jgi:neurofibromin 1
MMLIFLPDDAVSAAVLAPTISIASLVILALIAALIVMKRRKIGFFNEFKLREPDFAVVAFGPLLEEQYKVPKDNYDLLVLKLCKEPNFLQAVVGATAPTEEDSLARTLVNLYEKQDISLKMIVLLVTDEINKNEFENTLFRSNSVASKMFKFYSKVIGIRYLFNNLARFIMELNKLAEKKSSGESSGGNKSLLSMEMEVDPDKFGSSEAGFSDSEANLYQLILACQKVFSVIRDSTNEVPVEFVNIFQSMQHAVFAKFNSEEAIYKGVGGFLFLRFVCPAITAPHAYGLLEHPPNEIAQRQLVLIGKVIQSLANLQLPGAKEEFMLSMNDFMTRNLPKMKQFYIDLLHANTIGVAKTRIVEVPQVVVNNGMAWMYGHLVTNKAKLAAAIDKKFSPDEAAELHKGVKDMFDLYGDKIPKKIGGEKKKKK